MRSEMQVKATQTFTIRYCTQPSFRTGEHPSAERSGRLYFLPAAFSPGFFSPGFFSGSAAAASSLAFLAFLPILSTRTLGRPKGLRPSGQRSSFWRTLMRSARVITLRDRTADSSGAGSCQSTCLIVSSGSIEYKSGMIGARARPDKPFKHLETGLDVHQNVSRSPRNLPRSRLHYAHQARLWPYRP